MTAPEVCTPPAAREPDWKFIVFLYVNDARGWADSTTKLIDLNNMESWGALGANWLAGMIHSDEAAAKEEAREFRKTMEAKGYVIDSWNSPIF